MKILTALIVAMVVRTGQCKGICFQCRDTRINDVQNNECGKPPDGVTPLRICEAAEQTACSTVEHSFKVGVNDYQVADKSCVVAKDEESACAAARATAESRFGVVDDFVCRQATCDHDITSMTCLVTSDFNDWEEFKKQYLEAAAAAEESEEDDNENNGESYVSSETRVTASILLVGIRHVTSNEAGQAMPPLAEALPALVIFRLSEGLTFPVDFSPISLKFLNSERRAICETGYWLVNGDNKLTRSNYWI